MLGCVVGMRVVRFVSGESCLCVCEVPVKVRTGRYI
jgi:hypothetical protein